MREIILDVESTGLSISEDRIAEIGCVEVVDKVPTGNVFHCYIDPCKPMAREATKVHGLTDDFLRGKPTFIEVVLEFLEFIDGDPLVAHNATYDVGILNHELARIGLDPLPNQVVNTLPLARKVKKGGLHNLDALAKHYKVKIAREKHGALLDAKILARVYIELVGGAQQALRFEMPGQTQSPVLEAPRQRERPFRSVEVDLEFMGYMKTIPSAIWGDYVPVANSL